jgi:hypothetical protein
MEHIAQGERGKGKRFFIIPVGRSLRVFTTRIHLRDNAVGVPIGAALTVGRAQRVAARDDLAKRRNSDPGAMLTHNGYGGETICQGQRDGDASRRSRKIYLLHSRGGPLLAASLPLSGNRNVT